MDNVNKELEQLRANLMFFNLKEVARVSGISYPNLYRFAIGKTIIPTYKTISDLKIFLDDFKKQLGG